MANIFICFIFFPLLFPSHVTQNILTVYCSIYILLISQYLSYMIASTKVTITQGLCILL